MGEIVYEIDASSLSDRAYNVIKELVLSGKLKAGENISERSLATRFGLSRTPLREALRRLEQYGLVETRPRSATQVASLAPEEAEDVSRVRAALESVGVRALIARGTAEDFDCLDEISSRCDAALRSGNISQIFLHDSEFHVEIARRSGNRHLFEQYSRLDSKVQLLRLVLRLPVEHLRRFVAQHASLLKALRSREAEVAVHLIERHIMDQLKYQEVN